MQPFLSALKSPPFEATGAAACDFYGKDGKLPTEGQAVALCRCWAKDGRALQRGKSLPASPRENHSQAQRSGLRMKRRRSVTSEFSSSAAAETSDVELVPTTASIAFVWSAAMPLPDFRLFAGRCPTPHSCEIWRNHHEKERYQIQHPYGC